MREKVVLVVLMALGLFASAAAIVKVVLLTQKTTAQDPFWAAGNLFIWTNIEECLGIAAACIPNFRALFEKLLVHFGLTSIGTGERRSARGASWQIANNSSNHLNSFRMSTNRDSNHTKAKRAYGNASEEIILALKAHNLYLSDEMSGQNEVETSETTISFTKV